MLMLPGKGFAFQSPQLLFDRGVEALEENNFDAARSNFLQLLEEGFESGPLYLNLGIVAVQDDSLGLAKYYFLKAEDFRSTQEDALEGLRYVESRFSRQSAVLPKLPWEQALDWIKNEIGNPTLFIIGAVFFNFSILMLVASWFYVSKTMLFKKFGFSSGPIGIILVCLAFYVDYLDGRYHEAVMVVDQTNVVEQADENSDLVSLAYEGYSFTIDRRKSNEAEGWSYVRMSNGLYGWVKSNTIRTL
jgi:hypothetical protein